jgi:membrane-associated protein
METLNESIIELFFSVSPALRALLIFLLAFGEGLPIIGSFLPGGTIAILIGGLSQQGVINPWLAVHLIAIGSLLGDMIGFFFGKKMRHVTWVNNMVNSEKHAKKWDLFDRHAALVIILGKIVPVIRSTPSLFAGARNMNIGRYIFYVAIGSYTWGILGIWGGNYLAELVGDSMLVIIGVILLVSITATLISMKKKS